MLFNSYEFLLAFLPATALVFFILGRKGLYEPAVFWLVCASLFFYGWWEAKYILLLLASITVNFILGKNLQSSFSKGHNKNLRKINLTLGIVFNLGLLGYFKYANFFVNNTNNIFGTDYHLETIILPLAISFFTFQQIAFLADAYKGGIKDLSLLHYCLFVTFFPQLIAGPIVHHSYVLPQFARSATFSPRLKNILLGIVIFGFGLFKKVVLADSVAVYATPVFNMADAGANLGFAQAWLGALAYTCQIYFDFSGYSDMAIGLGRMFGISLPINFNSPYKSLNIIDFWSRWHMTLSQFLRDYLYYPLGGNRKGKGRRYINLMLVMLLGGLWHGAGWTFLLWGGLHGIYLIINHGWRAANKGKSSDSFATRVSSGMLTFIAVVIAYVPFRAETFTGVANMLSAMSGINGINLSTSGRGLITISILLAIVWLLPNTQELMRNYLDKDYYAINNIRGLLKNLTWQPNLAWSIALSTILIWTLMLLGRPTEFLYFQF